MAAFNFNKVILGGRLTADPELTQTQSGIARASFSVAVNKKVAKGAPQRADFFPIVAWRGRAEAAAAYLRKGSAVCVVGTLDNVFYPDGEGKKKVRTEIVAEEIIFIDAVGKSGVPEEAIDSILPQAARAVDDEYPF